MSEPRDATDSPAVTPPPPASTDLPLASPEPTPSSPLVRVGGLLGIAGTMLGLVLLVVGCAGYAKAMAAGMIVAGIGTLGFLIVLIGALTQRKRIGEDTHVLQALFACVLSILGGVLETAVYMKWPIIK